MLDVADAIKQLHERLPKLRKQRNLGQQALYKRAGDVSFETIRAAERPPGHPNHRYPSAEKLAAIAQGLGMAAEDFPEYRLALARAGLDETVVGINEAVARLDMIEAALGSAFLQALHDANQEQPIPADAPARTRGAKRAKDATAAPKRPARRKAQ